MEPMYWVIATSDDDGESWLVYGVRQAGTPEEEKQIPQIMEIIKEETGDLVGFWEVPFSPKIGETLVGVKQTLH